jgi:hypothetical protein
MSEVSLYFKALGSENDPPLGEQGARGALTSRDLRSYRGTSLTRNTPLQGYRGTSLTRNTPLGEQGAQGALAAFLGAGSYRGASLIRNTSLGDLADKKHPPRGSEGR